MLHDDEMVDLVSEVAGAALGFADLRPGQEKAAAAVVAGRDVLAVMPTGAGKSAVYQIAGALVPGATVVVSPLIALQQDQVAAIGEDLGGARQVNSSMTGAQRRETFAQLANGDLEFVLVAPEQLANPKTLDLLKAAEPSVFVVDEAHCISAWARFPARLPPAGIVHRGARAAADRGPDRHRGAARPPGDHRGARHARPCRRRVGLHASQPAPGGGDPGRRRTVGAVVERAVTTAGTGIVYVATRRQAEELAADIAARGKEAAAYHGGLRKGQRDGVHARFLAGGDFVVVATIAFGMGIDAPHVRFVLHADPPESLDAYYQEFGRAGRDNAPASAVLFRSRQSAGGRRFFAGTAELPVDVLATVAEATQAATEPIPLPSLAAVVKGSESRLAVAVDRLQRVGAVELDGEGCVAWTGTASVDELVDQAAADHERYRTTDRTRTEMMQRYLETGQCRWRTILGYFGEPSAENCGHCDNCDAGVAAVGTPGHHDELFPLGARVIHATFGTGEVVAYENGTITVLFDEAGYRTLSVDLVRQNRLLGPPEVFRTGDSG